MYQYKSQIHQADFIRVASNQSKKIEYIESRCPVCRMNSQQSRQKYTFEHTAIVTCWYCNTMHLSPLPSEQSLRLIYNHNYYKDEQLSHGYFDYASEEKNILKTYQLRFKKCMNLVPSMRGRSLRVHEVGCAYGFGLKYLRDKHNASVTGSDISKDAINKCQALNIKVFHSNAEGVNQNIVPGSLDMLVAFDLIEHLNDIEPFIKFVHKSLGKEGVLLITTPNMSSWLNRLLGRRSPSIKIPQHTLYFTTETLTKALEANFTLINSYVDWQFIDLANFFDRVKHILKLTKTRQSRCPNLSIKSPNGMRLYVFKKK